MSKFFEDFVGCYDNMMYSAIKGAAFMYMLNESKEADVEEIIKKYADNNAEQLTKHPDHISRT